MAHKIQSVSASLVLTDSPAPSFLTAILIAHLKLSALELRQILMTTENDRLEPSHIKQLLLYAPDEEELKNFKRHSDNPSKLSEPDKFAMQVGVRETLFHIHGPSQSALYFRENKLRKK